MAQMNVSISHKIEKFVRKSVNSGRYNSASEVVREALRRMEAEDLKTTRLATPSTEDVLADLTAQQIESIRARVIRGIEAIEAGNSIQFTGRRGVERFAARVKKRGRRLLAKRNSAR
jgi:antitoxin ParD1/3/4